MERVGDDRFGVAEEREKLERVTVDEPIAALLDAAEAHHLGSDVAGISFDDLVLLAVEAPGVAVHEDVFPRELSFRRDPLLQSHEVVGEYRVEVDLGQLPGELLDDPRRVAGPARRSAANLEKSSASISRIEKVSIFSIVVFPNEPA